MLPFYRSLLWCRCLSPQSGGDLPIQFTQSRTTSFDRDSLIGSITPTTTTHGTSRTATPHSSSRSWDIASHHIPAQPRGKHIKDRPKIIQTMAFIRFVIIITSIAMLLRNNGGVGKRGVTLMLQRGSSRNAASGILVEAWSPSSRFHVPSRNHAASPTIMTTMWQQQQSRTDARWNLSKLHASTKSTTEYNELDFGRIKECFASACKLREENMQSVPANLDLMLRDLETEASEPSFWDASNKERNAQVNAQISKCTRLQTRMRTWQSNQEDCEALLEMLDDPSLFTDDEQQAMYQEFDEIATALLEDGERYQLELLLSGPYDDQPCRIVVTAGAGGTEACDWVNDLQRMYRRHAEKMGYRVQVEDEQTGEVVGYKSIELLITDGPHPFGWFRNEKGAHRLVRLSPFNANNKRQTTFAGVDVAPVLMESQILDIDIPDKDLEISYMRSGGAGGQNVNKVNSAVRIKHLPSGLNIKCTQERSQSLNKEIAMIRLKGQLLAIANEQRVAEIRQIRGDQVAASWGEQVRNYVLHPYKMIKDQRSGWESTNAQAFLDGDLEDCVASLLQYRAAAEREDATE